MKIASRFMRSMILALMMVASVSFVSGCADADVEDTGPAAGSDEIGSGGEDTP